MANTINASTSSGLIQTADTSGIIEVQNNGSTKLSVGSGGTSIAQYNPSVSLISNATATSASGNFIDFTGIPSWAKRITVMFNGVSTNGSSNWLLQLGTGGVATTTGYTSAAGRVYSTTSTQTSTSGFILGWDNAAFVVQGIITFANLSGNTWVGSGTVSSSASTAMSISLGGVVGLAGVLNMVRITTVNGTDYFDAGTVNILYE